ncbi:MAG: DUF6320 domain-containing protein [Clostridia bacterium]|nr:DUF6320 domain-containing protein [Clostridia bacterium]
MSYCVNCGVELEKSLEICPLCRTEVVNPREPVRSDVIRPYSRHLDKVARKVQRRTVAGVFTVLLTLAGGICVITDGVYGGGLTWSLYVLASILLAMLVVVLPVYPLNWHPLFFVVIDCLALTLFMYVLNELVGGAQWFSTLALPLILLIMAVGAINVSVIDSGKLTKLLIAACIVGSMGVCTLGVEIVIDLYLSADVGLSWSWLVFAPCVAIAAILIIMDSNKRVKNLMRRRLHY